MKKMLSALLLSAAVGSVNAATFSVDVDIDVTIGDTPLVLEQTQAMQFPTLAIDEAAREGAFCSTGANTRGLGNAIATSANSLCPNQAGTPAIATLTGVPNAVVTYTYNVPTQTEAGVSFTGLNTTRTAVLAASGSVQTIPLTASVTLENSNEVSSGTYQFTYDITAAYQ